MCKIDNEENYGVRCFMTFTAQLIVVFSVIFGVLMAVITVDGTVFGIGGV